MSSFSNYTENAVLNMLFNQVPFTPTPLYMGLFKAETGLEDNALATAEEVVDASSYARVDVEAFGGYTTATTGSVANVNDLDFPVALADWGTITHTALLDAPTGGNVIAWGALANPRTIYAADSVKVRAGANVITLN